MSFRVRTSTRDIGTKLALTDAAGPVVELGADVVFLRECEYGVSWTFPRLRSLDPVRALLDCLATKGRGHHSPAELVARFNDDEVINPALMKCPRCDDAGHAAT